MTTTNEHPTSAKNSTSNEGEGVPQIVALLAEHASCNRVTSREGMTIWSCRVQTPEPARDSTVGYVDLHREHVAVALERIVADRLAPHERVMRYAGMMTDSISSDRAEMARDILCIAEST